MFADIAEAPRPVAPSGNGVSGSQLETVPENSKTTDRSKTGSQNAPSPPSTSTGSKEVPPPKTDKPRPHICLTCKRCFARLEHLKRHERSHTKEKPFECPECTRCFARRDLLLRHQQKLHMTTTPSSRPRGGRRESTSSTMSGSGKIRKNSTSHSGAGSMRPRANTISNIGNPAMEMFANMGIGPGALHSPPLAGYGHVLGSMPPNMRPHMVPGHHGTPSGLPKLNTSVANADTTGGLRTAPIFTDSGFGMDTFFSPDTGVNPAALHFPDSIPNPGLDSPSPFQEVPGFHMGHMAIDSNVGMDWMQDFGTDLSMMSTNDSQAIAGSSPSVIDTDSPEEATEYSIDRNSNMPQHSVHWQDSQHFAKSTAALPEYMMDMGLNDSFVQSPPSPGLMHDFTEGHFPNSSFQLQNPLLSPMMQPIGVVPQQQQFASVHGSGSPSTMASTTDGSGRQNSFSSGHHIAVPEATRNAMMANLSQPSLFGQRKYSQPSVSSPLSPSAAAKAQQVVNMPSTVELQRFITAYVRYFHPHMPFLHIPSLSFDSPEPNSQHSDARSPSPVSGVANSGACLILAMSAIGALYEMELEVSKTLFNFSKRMLSMFLEERRKADMASSLSSPKSSSTTYTPVWLVQAMLLNVVYGHMCGDKTAEINALTHGAALVSLARSANLTDPSKKTNPVDNHAEVWNPKGDDPTWYEWRTAEEKKRTLYSVFTVSSILTAAYNHGPALKNGEITLDLPCDEDLWCADSAEAWYAISGNVAADQNTVPFNLALNSLLTAHTRQPIPLYQMSQAFCKPGHPQQNSPDWPRPEFHASTFGCAVLIYALHNYIWETRQRHGSRQWTATETEDMHRQIEPALVAWQTVWSAVPHHSVERPNPFGMGPMAADSIPLLDLAYLVLYVNMGRSKEFFWTRDFEEMSREIASGYEMLPHAEADGDGSSQQKETSVPHQQKQQQAKKEHDSKSSLDETQIETDLGEQRASRRERQLRKAASHAANSMILSARSNTTFADFNSRELPIQAALCVFTSAQVLAEWVATLQERVGPYIGILGVDSIDLHSVPAVVLLDQDDILLVEQMEELVSITQAKLLAGAQSGKFPAAEGIQGMGEGEAGYAARLLHITGAMLANASIWPIMRLMKQGLDVQSGFMKDRAERSRAPRDTKVDETQHQ